MDKLLLQLLGSANLNDKQRRVYLALLQLGQSSVSQIADLAELKRPITYVVIDELVELGYVRDVVGSKKKTFVAVDPNKIMSDLKQSAKSFEEMLPYFRAIQRKTGKPHVEYYSGVKEVTLAHKQIYKPKEVRYVTSIVRAKQEIPSEVTRWHTSYSSGKARPGGKHLLTYSEDDREYAEALIRGRQEVRFLPQIAQLDVDVALVDNAMYLTSFEDSVNVTVIHSEAVYKAFCSLYDLAWASISMPMKY